VKQKARRPFQQLPDLIPELKEAVMFWTKIAGVLFAILLLSLSGNPAQAEKRVALIIGNSTYANTPAL
jgi:hypothetical protein